MPINVRPIERRLFKQVYELRKSDICFSRYHKSLLKDLNHLARETYQLLNNMNYRVYFWRTQSFSQRNTSATGEQDNTQFTVEELKTLVSEESQLLNNIQDG